jgi:16S rRNA (guanine1207-N2)-methyltransferase
MTEHYFSAHPESTTKLGLIKTNLCGRQFEFFTSSSVFSKKRVDTGTRLLIESMVLPENGMVLDIGCGYGAVGIVAAAFKPATKVVMTDVNMRAVRLARDNVEHNHMANAEVKHGFLYEPVEGLSFNVVLSNPPVSAGMNIVKSIINQAPRVMAAGATFQMVIRSKIGAKNLPALLESVFGNCRILAREGGYRVLLAERSS